MSHALECMKIENNGLSGCSFHPLTSQICLRLGERACWNSFLFSKVQSAIKRHEIHMPECIIYYVTSEDNKAILLVFFFFFFWFFDFTCFFFQIERKCSLILLFYIPIFSSEEKVLKRFLAWNLEEKSHARKLFLISCYIFISAKAKKEK